MVDIGGEGLDQLKDRLGDLSERQAAYVRGLLDRIAKKREEARRNGMNVAVASADKILLRLKGGHTPFIWAMIFNFRTPVPGTLRVEVYFDNPDPVPQGFLYVHFFVGPANLVADPVQSLSFVDDRFPRVTEPQFAGLFMDPFTSSGVVFEIAIPGQIQESHYLGNAFLIQQSPFTVPGEVLDRASTVFKLQDQ